VNTIVQIYFKKSISATLISHDNYQSLSAGDKNGVFRWGTPPPEHPKLDCIALCVFADLAPDWIDRSYNRGGSAEPESE
jgi:hypothetical protein